MVHLTAQLIYPHSINTANGRRSRWNPPSILPAASPRQHGKPSQMHGMDSTAFPYAPPTDILPLSSHPLVAGGTPGLPKDSSPQEMATTAVLMLSSPMLSARSAVLMTLSIMTKTLRSTGGGLLTCSHV